MRNLHLLDAYRRTDRVIIASFGGIGDHETGAFEMPSIVDRAPMMIIASVGNGWDHVSVSRRTRCPNWAEMEQVAQAFFKEGETAMQLHVPVSDHVNDHPYCLHWWRPLDCEIPRPPSWMVGGVTRDDADRLAREDDLSRMQKGARS